MTLIHYFNNARFVEFNYLIVRLKSYGIPTMPSIKQFNAAEAKKCLKSCILLVPFHFHQNLINSYPVVLSYQTLYNMRTTSNINQESPKRIELAHLNTHLHRRRYVNSFVMEVTCGKCKWVPYNGSLYSEEHYEIARVTVEVQYTLCE